MIAINNEFPGQRPFTSLNFLDHPSGLDVLQACNGLFCCCCIESNETKRKYYIYNRTNKQFTTLPQFHVRAVRPVLGINLAFDPSKSQHYKVVCVRSCESPHGQHQIEMYSSVAAGSWRLAGVPFTAHWKMSFHNRVYWNGAIHWISQRGSSLYLDVNKEMVQEMPMPPFPDEYDERRVRYLGESSGYLLLIEI